MKLNELLKYDDIVIQCHDNPDADALASGYGVYWYLEKMGKNPKFIYRGNNEIQKSNLLMMISALEVPVDYAPNFYEKPELLVVVDCQYGQSNVTKTEAGTVAVRTREGKDLGAMPLEQFLDMIGKEVAEKK